MEQEQNQNNTEKKSSKSYWIYGLTILALFFFARQCSCDGEEEKTTTEQVTSGKRPSNSDQIKAMRLQELQEQLQRQGELVDQQYQFWQAENFVPNSSAVYYLKRSKSKIFEICDEMAQVGRELGSESDYQEAMRTKQKFINAFAQMGI